MSEIRRTLIFVAVAAVGLLGAVSTYYGSQPASPEKFSQVGREFYSEFDDPTAAKSLEVITYDQDTASVENFKVEYKDGLWRIPSHHGYPADAEEQLAKTAASIIGIRREELRSTSEKAHEELGVIDPLDDAATSLKGRGHRITLKDEEGTVLADYIIGKEVKNRSGFYYIRRKDEKSTYVAELDLDITTKFADWIEPDLLKLEKDNLVEAVINKYKIDSLQGTIDEEEVNRLTRETFSDPWKLEGFNEEDKELDSSQVNSLVNALDNLKIIGVRPKPPGLSEGLKLNEGIELDRATRLDLQSRGFAFTSQGELKSNEGELIAATNEGLLYVLRFGEIFTGSEQEIQIGKSDNETEQADEEEKKESAGGEEGQEDSQDQSSKRGRYLFATVHFSKNHIGDPPTKPVKPKKPGDASGEKSEKEKSEEKEKDSGEKSKEAGSKQKKASDSDTDTKQKEEGSEGSDNKPSEGDESGEATEKDPQAEYEKALQQYEADLAAYKKELKEYEEKVEKGRKRAQELNSRFADWYYVVSAENFENLRLGRDDLIKPKEENEEGTPTGNRPSPQIPPSLSPSPSDKPSPESNKEESGKDESGEEKSADTPSPPEEKSSPKKKKDSGQDNQDKEKEKPSEDSEKTKETSKKSPQDSPSEEDSQPKENPKQDADSNKEVGEDKPAEDS